MGKRISQEVYTALSADCNVVWKTLMHVPAVSFVYFVTFSVMAEIAMKMIMIVG